MPELPEVETIRTGLAPRLEGRMPLDIAIHRPDLRWPIPAEALRRGAIGQVIREVSRRGKYLLLSCDAGHQLIHLGMSGRLLWLEAGATPQKHDHVVWTLDDGQRLGLRDPRRFGALLWIPGADHREAHPLLAGLGPEPLSDAFDGAFFHAATRNRRGAIKAFIMNARMVTGVGNIYASEALFSAGIHPSTPAGALCPDQCATLVASIRQVLREAIRQGGTTLRDYRQSDGRLGYFARSLQVYGRADQPCPICRTPIALLRHGHRSAYFCPRCQPPFTG